MEKFGKGWSTGTTGTGTLTTGNAHPPGGYDPDDTQPVTLTEDETWDQGTYWINGIINGMGRSELQLAQGGAYSDQTNLRRRIREQDGWGDAATELRQ